MADPYLGEIRMFGGNFAPAGWAFCNGATIAISENPALFNVIGTTYGGDGQSTFALPNLQGRVPVHQGAGFPLAAAAGAETVTLTVNQLPVHTHTFLGSKNPGAQGNPPGNAVAAIVAGAAYLQAPATVALAPASLTADPGGSQPHDNMQPYLAVNFIIAMYGIYPSPG